MNTILRFTFVAALMGQQLPVPSDVIKLRTEAMQKHRTLQFVAESAMQVKVDGQPPINTANTTSVALQAGKSRFESKGQFTGVMIYDDDFIWVYRADTGQYSKTPAAMEPANVLASAAVPDLPEAANILTNAKVLRDEGVNVDGKPRPAWVLQIPLIGSYIPAAQGADYPEAAITQWIDKELGIALQSMVTLRVMRAGVNAVTEMRMNVKDLKIDEPISESLFAFIPPPNSTQVAGIGLPGLSGIPATRLSSPAPVVPRNGNCISPPTILSRIEPQYSDLARQARIQGTVVLQATIDQDGRAKVTNVVRALGYGLDENAVAAIEQWQFRPGMKNCVPVAVSLNIEVNFNLGAPPPRSPNGGK